MSTGVTIDEVVMLGKVYLLPTADSTEDKVAFYHGFCNEEVAIYC